MKRSQALQPLSRDHHEALFNAMLLRRVKEETLDESKGLFLKFWESEMARHFQIEEEVLLSGIEPYCGSDSEVVAQVLSDHRHIRATVDHFKKGEATVDELHDLGECISAHVRLEERELFPLIEGSMPEDKLKELGEKIGQAESA